jgi:hypothetical protein
MRGQGAGDAQTDIGDILLVALAYFSSRTSPEISCGSRLAAGGLDFGGFRGGHGFFLADRECVGRRIVYLEALN